ncbi:DUF4394 domain-containing protein [Pseudonocardia abyssalis]|uniref:Uncharacterized protein n=1 Tax=Pseudonocardia abyssalis TaxID=2792008 RepID=A0ABS6UWG9_9PSEU|nr:DUF4394 domain-containing protein [Pseudonocardia abyssalis]MBW0136581.1 hypothetical protein [Pseudonocardia abyssalis]
MSTTVRRALIAAAAVTTVGAAVFAPAAFAPAAFAPAGKDVAIRSPANAGTLAPTGTLPVDIGSDAGFDIHSTLAEA